MNVPVTDVKIAIGILSQLNASDIADAITYLEAVRNEKVAAYVRDCLYRRLSRPVPASIPWDEETKTTSTADELRKIATDAIQKKLDEVKG